MRSTSSGSQADSCDELRLLPVIDSRCAVPVKSPRPTASPNRRSRRTPQLEEVGDELHRLRPPRLDSASRLEAGQAIQQGAVLAVVLLGLHAAVLADDQLELLTSSAVELVLRRVL